MGLANGLRHACAAFAFFMHLFLSHLPAPPPPPRPPCILPAPPRPTLPGFWPAQPCTAPPPLAPPPPIRRSCHRARQSDPAALGRATFLTVPKIGFGRKIGFGWILHCIADAHFMRVKKIAASDRGIQKMAGRISFSCVHLQRMLPLALAAIAASDARGHVVMHLSLNRPIVSTDDLSVHPADEQECQVDEDYGFGRAVADRHGVEYFETHILLPDHSVRRACFRLHTALGSAVLRFQDEATSVVVDSASTSYASGAPGFMGTPLTPVAVRDDNEYVRPSPTLPAPPLPRPSSSPLQVTPPLPFQPQPPPPPSPLSPPPTVLRRGDSFGSHPPPSASPPSDPPVPPLLRPPSAPTHTASILASPSSPLDGDASPMPWWIGLVVALSILLPCTCVCCFCVVLATRRRRWPSVASPNVGIPTSRDAIRRGR